MEQNRDRPYIRVIKINIGDRKKLLSILDSIPRKNVIRIGTSGSNTAQYIVSIKKQELLVIKLAINVISVERAKRPKNPFLREVVNF